MITRTRQSHVTYIKKHLPELEFEVNGYEQFRDVLNEVRERFSKVIRSYEHFLFFKEHKISYMPK